MNYCDHLRRKLFACSLLLAVVVLAGSPALAVVVISDGFGDADIDNDGMAFEPNDTNLRGSRFVTTYRPGRVDQPGDFNHDGKVNFIDYTEWRDNLGGPDDGEIDDQGDGVDGVTAADYAIWKANFGANSQANPEITAPAIDPSDTGIRWLQMRGFTSAFDGNIDYPGAGTSKPTIRIVDDSQDSMLETRSSGPGSLNKTAIDDGYAMAWESRGGGSAAAGFFDQNIALGPQVDDEVKVSFDFRIWRDAPNANGSNPNNEPTRGELRFGLFQDTDNQLGQSNPFAGRQVDEDGDALPNQETDFRPAVWGQEEGLFEGAMTGTKGVGDDIGTNGDNGWTASVFMGGSSFLEPNGGASRIREEVQVDRILQGNDTQTVAKPENVCETCGPFDPGQFDFIDLDLSKAYNIELSLKRAMVMVDMVEEPTIFAELTITDLATQETWSFGDQDNYTHPIYPGLQSESWDYFALRNASSGAGEFDFIMDNFKIEVNGSNAPSLLTGSANVPEPSSILIVTFAGMSLLLMNRYRS